MPNKDSLHDLAGKCQPLESPPRNAETAYPLGLDSRGCGGEHGLREGTSPGGEDSRDTRPDRATRYVETIRGILSYAQLAPLLADRVATVEADLFREKFAGQILDENLLLSFHRQICADLTPDWAGRWRSINVTVGTLQPPEPHLIPMLMRDYGLDLQARWPAASARDSALTLELLAFAEGRFLTIHPFRDFNGRTIRLFLTEILRRLDLPRVVLAPTSEEERQSYFKALEAADNHDLAQLMAIWEKRLSNAFP